MKIKTITCHDVYNYGASLQAYALQAYLASKGHDVEIIDYKPDYLSKHYKFKNICNSKYNSLLLNILYVVAKLPGYWYSLKRRNLFDIFRKNYLHLTDKQYHNISELRIDPPQADIYVAGSDQIWNTSFPNGKDPSFYLDFAASSSVRSSYAASFATECIALEEAENMRMWLSRMDYISIREKESLPLLESLSINNGVSVVDPVFLLPKSHWILLSERGMMKLQKPYVLVYNFEWSSVTREIVDNIRKTNQGLSVYELSPVRLGLGKNIYRHVGPLQFLYLIRNAKMIISNSFHASAFSVIFEKNFCVVSRTDNMNIRMKSFLNEIKIPDRFASKYSQRLLENIDYNSIDIVLREMIQDSIKYINSIVRS